MSASNEAHWLSDNLVPPQPTPEATIRSFQKILDEAERSDWPMTGGDRRMFLDNLLVAAAEYWNECVDPRQPEEPCS